MMGSVLYDISPSPSAMFECEVFGGWKDEDAKAIIKELPEILKRDGWDKTRKALAVTVR